MVKAEFPIGKTQWAKWGDEAREAYNRMRRQGFTHEVGVDEGNAVQAKVRAAALQELAEPVKAEEKPTGPVKAQGRPAKFVRTAEKAPVKRRQTKKD